MSQINSKQAAAAPASDAPEKTARAKNLSHWPPALPLHLELPETSMSYNLEVSATRYPRRVAMVYYGVETTYRQLKQESDALAGYLASHCGVRRGDRVALYLQNCPQFAVALYAIMRAGAAAVLVNTMNLLEEVRHVVTDSGARVIVFGQELAANVTPMLGSELNHAIDVCYADAAAGSDTDLPVPDVVTMTRVDLGSGVTPWQRALAHAPIATATEAGPDDLAVLPYTSGTTGAPKGCMITHRNMQHTAIGSPEFCRVSKDQVALSALPFFHVTGLQNGLNSLVYGGSTMVIMTRWDRRCAAMLIARYRVTSWTAIPAMLMDFLAQPDLDQHDLSSMALLTGGGAAMPKAVAARIEQLWGLPYVEGYGLSETISATHTNPVHRPKPQCLGIPIQDVSSIIVDPDTRTEKATGEVGEILVHGPQVFQGYWGKPEATEAAFVSVDDVLYFRTGDLGYVDEEGYFFLVDRLKRMINASGYKVWPAEVEAMLYAHPGVQEACVIACRDAHRGESVKALIVKRAGQELSGEDLITWARTQMSAYKVPHVVEFVDSLPRSGTGKVAWRALQEKELAKPD